MPIKGLSDRQRLPRLGKIHLGVKVPNKGGNGDHPVATDYFVVPEELYQYTGETPKSLNVIIPTPDPETWASQFYRCYSRTRGLVCKGDGETAERMIDTDTGYIAGRDTKPGHVQWGPITCEGRACELYAQKQCRETMNLQFLLPEVPGIGVWQIDTSSINSILNINSCVAMIKWATGGRIHGIPLQLTLEPTEVVNPDDGKKKTVHCMNLRYDEKLATMLAIAARPAALALMPAPDDAGVPDDYPELPPSDEEPPTGVMEQQTRGDIKDEPADIVKAKKQPPATKAKAKQDKVEPPAPPLSNTGPSTAADLIKKAAQTAPGELPEGTPPSNAMGNASPGELAILQAYAEANGYTMDELWAFAKEKGLTATEWNQITKRQERALAVAVKNGEVKHDDKGPGPEPAATTPGATVPADPGADAGLDDAGLDDDEWEDLAAADEASK